MKTLCTLFAIIALVLAIVLLFVRGANAVEQLTTSVASLTLMMLGIAFLILRTKV